jgi:putative ABC transport system permease protein
VPNFALNKYQLVLRSLVHNRVRTFTVILQLVLATVATMVSLTLIQGRERALLPSDLFKVAFTQQPSGLPVSAFTGQQAQSLTSRVSGLQAAAAYNSSNRNEIIVSGRRFVLFTSLEGSSTLPAVLKLERVAGDLRLRIDGSARSLLLQENLAKALFTSPEQAIGKNVVFRPAYGSSEPMRVRGVYRLNDEAVGTLNAQAIYGAADGVRLPVLMVRANPGKAQTVQEGLSTELQSTFQELIASGVQLKSFRDKDTNVNPRSGDTNKGLDRTLVVFSGFGAVLLAASTLGLYATALASTVERERDRAIKLALGVRPYWLFVEGLLEALLLSMVGVTIGAMIAVAFIGLIEANVGPYLFERSLSIQAEVLLQAMVSVVLVNLAASFHPLILAAKVKPAALFREA